MKGQQDFSFTDCASFSIMNDLSVKVPFAFDGHFEKADFIASS
jgi:predicted nucleic acid-binding protein